MSDERTQTDGLEAYFSAARVHAPEPSAALLERITQDALAAHPAKPAPAAHTSGWLRQLWKGLGGWPAISGLATATVAGVWIGVNPPTTVALIAESYIGTESAGYFIDYNANGAFDLAEEAL